MSKKSKAFLYNFISFATLFIIFRFIIAGYTGLSGIMIPLTAFVVVTLTAPKFQVISTQDGEKIYMKWMFIKGVKEVK